MAKRLQVGLQDSEYREIQRIARARRMSIAEWVREALDAARQREPLRDAGKKLEVIRDATRHEYPTAEVDEMLEQIERGYDTAP